jgi:hypothetical protein
MARRDVWLSREVRWQVRARQGDSEGGEEWRWEYDDEQSARDMVDRLLAADGPGQWQDITAVTRSRRSDQVSEHRPGPRLGDGRPPVGG